MNAKLSDSKKQALGQKVLNCFRRDGMILYVGQGCGEIPRSVAGQSWNCVYTSRRQGWVANAFTVGDGRTVSDWCYEHSWDQAKVTDRRDLQIVRLFGLESRNGTEDNTQDPFVVQSQATELLETIRSVMHRSMYHLLIVGYDPDSPDEIDRLTLFKILRSLPKGSVSVFGVSEEQYSKEPSIFRTLEESIKVEVYEDSLGDILDAVDAPLSQDLDLALGSIRLRDSGEKSFYADGEDCVLRQDWIAYSQNFAHVLTIEDVDTGRIYGRDALQDRFYHFLRDSATEWPQWYGYQSYHDFHLKRPWEDSLYHLVTGLLDDSGEFAKKRAPVLLYGPPGSSKSISLAALAYRVFQDKIHPVVYMRDPYLIFKVDEKSFERLNELLKHLEEAGPRQQNVLLIWDCSCYGVKPVQTLYNSLCNSGRKVTLVCSTYDLPSRKDDAEPFPIYQMKDDKLVKLSSVSSGEPVIECVDGFYRVRASRELGESEEFNLLQLCKRYADYDETILKTWWDQRAQEESDIFLRLYYLMQFLRGPLSGSLKREYDTVLASGNLPLKAVSLYDSVMAAAFEKAGLDLSSLNLEGSVQEAYHWEDMCICIAMFSQFGFALPESIALTTLDPDFKGGYTLLRDIFQTIPWLHYGPAGGNEDNGEYVFTYRTPLEAQLFLSAREVTEAEQIDYVINILEMIGAAFEDTGEKDQKAILAIDKFIRMIGPNTENESLRNERRSSLLKYAENYPKIIDHGLAPLRTEYGLYDERLLNLEVTLTREFYGRDQNRSDRSVVLQMDMNSAEGYCERIQRLQGAMELAKEGAERLKRQAEKIPERERGWYLREARSLLVEHVCCDRDIQELSAKYHELSSKAGVPANEQIDTDALKLSFDDYWTDLSDAIDQQPNNGYIYNATFRLFLRDCKNKGNNTAGKIRNLVHVWQLIEDLNNNPMITLERGGQEFQENVAKISQEYDRLINNTKAITLDNVEQLRAAVDEGDEGDEGKFLSLFNTCLTHMDASAILFLVRDHLRKAGVKFSREDSKAGLSEQARAACQKALAFLDSYSFTEDSASCIFLRIQLYWKLWNDGISFIPPAECWRPRLKYEQWSKLYQLCENYRRCADKSRHVNGLLNFVEALTLAELGEYNESLSTLHSIPKGRFYSNDLRLKAWYIVSDWDDKVGGPVPRKFSGHTMPRPDAKNFVGGMHLDGVPDAPGGHYFSVGNLKQTGLDLRQSSHFEDLELGVGFTGFSVYRKTSVEGKK